MLGKAERHTRQGLWNDDTTVGEARLGTLPGSGDQVRAWTEHVNGWSDSSDRHAPGTQLNEDDDMEFEDGVLS